QGQEALRFRDDLRKGRQGQQEDGSGLAGKHRQALERQDLLQVLEDVLRRRRPRHRWEVLEVVGRGGNRAAAEGWEAAHEASGAGGGREEGREGPTQIARRREVRSGGREKGAAAE